MRRIAVLLVVALLLPAAAAAQSLPSYAVGASRPTETIRGRITEVKSAYAFTLWDDRGFYDNVVLREGTAINPVGLNLAPGMVVTITGSNAGDVFAADVVDSALAYNGPLPAPTYYGPGWWYPGFAFGYGPAFALGLLGGATVVLVQRPFFHRHPFHPFHPFARRFVQGQPFGTTTAGAMRSTSAAGPHTATGSGHASSHATHSGRR